MNNKVCIYLRKSRADEELEKTIGEGETLRKHKDALLKYAKTSKLNIVEIKKEIVSGDSLFFRPKMLELLKEVEANTYYGVLVMDIDRLGRGGMKDQGTILETFKESNTLIITPSKTYDLSDEYDEEMTEFKTFFARRELKSITKRMQGGRVRSVEDGNYIATNPPLGYDIHFIGKCRTLKINEHESEIIKIIFNMYENGDGATAIASYLTSLGFKSKTGKDIHKSTVLTIIKNHVYTGKVTWKKRDERKSKVPGKRKDCRTRDKSEWIIATGKHEPIISEDQFNKCHEILKGRYHIPYQLTRPPVNPLSGLITCDICNRKMTMRPSKGINRIMCTHKCANISSRFDIVEEDLLKGLESYLVEYEHNSNLNETKNTNDLLNKQFDTLKKELSNTKDQKNKLFDFLERGIYDEVTFIERSQILDKRAREITINISKLENTLDKSNSKSNIDFLTFKNVIVAYKKEDDVALKNKLLKSILYEIRYEKTDKSEDFKLSIAPKLLR